MILTIDDIETLIEAVNEWEKSDYASGLVAGMIGMIFSSDENKENAKKRFEETINKASSKSEAKKEIGILLKAKLIQIKQSIGR